MPRRRHKPIEPGDAFDRLTVESLARKTPRGEKVWLCRCVCGGAKEVRGSNLIRGYVRSCGCYRRECARQTLARNNPPRVVRPVEPGRVFGRLTVVGPDPSRARPGRPSDGYWHCQCDCGNRTSARAGNLLSGSVRSCGCLRGPSLEKRAHNALGLLRRRFGRLRVVERLAERAGNGAVLWLCRCRCGNEARVNTHNLTSGNTQSCGCLQRDRSREANRRQTD